MLWRAYTSTALSSILWTVYVFLFEAAAAKAVQLVHDVKGELLMKGSLHTES
jgi:hypothetical protein